MTSSCSLFLYNFLTLSTILRWLITKSGVYNGSLEQWSSEISSVVIRDKLIYDLCYEEGQWNCAVFSLLAKTTESLWCQLCHWRHRDEYQIIYNHNNPRQIANICIVTDMHLTWYVENRHRFRMFFNTYISGLNSIRPGHTHILSDPCIIHNKYITLKSTS